MQWDRTWVFDLVKVRILLALKRWEARKSSDCSDRSWLPSCAAEKRQVIETEKWRVNGLCAPQGRKLLGRGGTSSKDKNRMGRQTDTRNQDWKVAELEEFSRTLEQCHTGAKAKEWWWIWTFYTRFTPYKLQTQKPYRYECELTPGFQ